MPPPPALRNIAIIAHVDHGKTTLVDAMLRQSGTFRASEGLTECVMDSNPLERERGITILAKNCAVTYQVKRGPRAGEIVRVNIIDTPGHADFGGEVERVLRMADGALLLVDAMDGPMPQTRFVLSKALELGLRLIVVVNKCDRPEARPQAVVNEVFDLLIDLGAGEEALDFPVVYASGRDGWASNVLPDPASGAPRPDDVDDLFQQVVAVVPPPKADLESPAQMLVNNLDYSDYTGRIAIGRVFAGTITSGMPVVICKHDGAVKRARVQRVLRFEGLGRVDAGRVDAGDLCALEGLADIDIGDTICHAEHPRPLPRVHVDDPTLHMVFRINDGPFVGKEGRFVTSRQIWERLQRELQANVALRVAPGDSAEEFRVSGRGLLHLGVLLENMRREGYELTVGRPEVIEREIDGERCEPIERLSLDVSTTSMGPALELLGSRGGEIIKMEQRGGRMHLEASIPARGLIGFRSKLLNATGGEAVLHHTFERYAPFRAGVDRKRINGVMIAMDAGTATHYAIESLSDRGMLFVKPVEKVYEGMIVGEHSRENDLNVNIIRAKQLTNFRETSKDQTVVLKPPRIHTLESALEYIEDDELVEITPQSIRLRKRMLKETDRKRSERSQRDREAAAAR